MGLIGDEYNRHSALSAVGGSCRLIGIMIGALGASFEQQQYFRHVVFVVVVVDEEL